MHEDTRILSRRVHAACRAADWWAVDVVARPAFELMLLCFPRVTLATSPEEESAAYA